MTKVMKWLGGSVAGVIGGVALLGASGTFNATDAAAESPPAPPARFVGTVLVDGQQPAAGTVIEARVGATSCGVSSTYSQGSAMWYAVDVAALDPGANPELRRRWRDRHVLHRWQACQRVRSVAQLRHQYRQPLLHVAHADPRTDDCDRVAVGLGLGLGLPICFGNHSRQPGPQRPAPVVVAARPRLRVLRRRVLVPRVVTPPPFGSSQFSVLALSRSVLVVPLWLAAASSPKPGCH